MKQLRNLSNLLDNAIRIPGMSRGIGLDPIIGLIPGGGDLVGGALSAYIIFKAFQLGVPQPTLMRMASNIATETLVGTVPVFGDVFDVAWRANVKNVELLESHLDSPEISQKADRGFIILLIGGLLLLILLVAAFSVVVFAGIIKILNVLVPG
ncbi:MAG: DUF4112 domain-containing protein [Oscillatoriales cyanobacterium RM1_1_9]|nr:DUF4112 domain-containing protein [Oscillatoriales cyanobacterium RM1_1_9]